jgi:hypothetical protein
MKKKYLVRLDSNSQAQIIELDDKGYEEAVKCGYQICPL